MKQFIKGESEKARVLLLILLDIVVINGSGLLALLLRFDLRYSEIDMPYLQYFYDFIPTYTVCTIVIFILCRLYKSLWRYASVQEIWYIILAAVLSSGLEWILMWYVKGYRMPIGGYHLYKLIFIIGFTTAGRFMYRAARYINESRRMILHKNYIKRTMLVGAGECGRIMLKEIRGSRHLNNQVVCIIDKDPAKAGKLLQGVPIVGGDDTILQNVEKYGIDEIIIALPKVSARERKKVLEICQRTECSVRILPGVYQLINGDVKISQLREIEVEDLLGRDPIEVDMDGIMGYVSNKVIMVTGGGGSIGSELCRQLAAKEPKRLIIVDIYENNAYDIQQELLREYPNLDLVVLIASVRNTKRMRSIYQTYCPQIVYHAAAHKHVPLMETSPNEAIKNNVFGTYKTANLAGENGVEKFVLISTDKAVNPTNIMGASKRICEMVIQTLNHIHKTEYVAVRFGNVLGSNGSVIPLFKNQIKEGGPVTVTHPDIIRYFMTIPEAVSLVLQAGAYAKGGEIFVLDMGEPVKIYDLAVNLIRLSGYRPEEDIEIQFTGLRPGEKLYEELLMNEEGLEQTPNQLIFIGNQINFDEMLFLKQLKELEIAASEETSNIRKLVHSIVPTYKIPQKDNEDQQENIA